ncbi:MAG TPA: hypothetical protein PLW44_05735 [Chitinophagales bacterium]|nr:hypothetical protein [Chitinophagales bacterium]
MVIIGLGGLTKDILHDLLQQYSTAELLFFTEIENDANIAFFKNLNLQVSYTPGDIENHFAITDKRFLVLVGNNIMREKLVLKYTSMGGTPHYFVSNSANINIAHCTFSKTNTVILHSAMISAGAVINEGAIINQFSYLGHDTVMGRYSFLGGYSCISNGTIGDFAFIGIKTVILPGRSVGNHSLVGAMSLINKSVGDRKKAYGTPVKEYPL